MHSEHEHSIHELELASLYGILKDLDKVMAEAREARFRTAAETAET